MSKSLETLKYVTTNLEFGINLINGGEFYGQEDANLKLLKRFVDSNTPEFNRKLVFCIKGAVLPGSFGLDGNEKEVTRSIENVISYFPEDISMRPKIVFECARVDPNVPYEDSISYIANYAKAGKIDGITISEIGSKSIKKAASTFPISFTEVELSLMCQDLISNGVLKTASELGIPIIAYFPLCGGYLTDSATQMGTNFLKDEHKGDVRNHLVKLLKENIPQNMKLFKKLYEFSRCKENFS